MRDNEMNGKNRKKQQVLIVAGDPKKIMSQISSMAFSNEFAIEIAREIWRLEKYIEKIGDVILKNPADRSNTIYDQIQRIKDIFKKHEIEVIDHIGEKYNEGMSVKVLHVEESDELPHGQLEIIETIQPSIYVKGKNISHGEVIVRKGK